MSTVEQMTIEEQRQLQAFVQELSKRHTVHQKRMAQLQSEIETKMQRLHEQQRRLVELDSEEQDLQEALQFAVERGVSDQLDQLRSTRMNTENAQDRLQFASMKLNERTDFLGQSQTKVDQFRRQLDVLRENKQYRSMIIRQALLAGLLCILTGVVAWLVGHMWMSYSLVPKTPSVLDSTLLSNDIDKITTLNRDKVSDEKTNIINTAGNHDKSNEQDSTKSIKTETKPLILIDRLIPKPRYNVATTPATTSLLNTLNASFYCFV
ncbi:hypothetical protein BDF19DRAFT_444582 [Syncephalis fuscata]|nr:hypothetical protein BDF19DRAFT_444582 [Syncephalis fuscata]